MSITINGTTGISGSSTFGLATNGSDRQTISDTLVTYTVPIAVSGASSMAAGGSMTTTATNDGAISSGTYTLTPIGGNMRYITNAGIFSIAAPTVSGDYTMILQITNVTGAGTMTLSGFSKTTGSALTSTVGSSFLVYVTKVNGFTFANVVAL